jgi:hypothetical protein
MRNAIPRRRTTRVNEGAPLGGGTWAAGAPGARARGGAARRHWAYDTLWDVERRYRTWLGMKWESFFCYIATQLRHVAQQRHGGQPGRARLPRGADHVVLIFYGLLCGDAGHKQARPAPHKPTHNGVRLTPHTHTYAHGHAHTHTHTLLHRLCGIEHNAHIWEATTPHACLRW